MYVVGAGEDERGALHDHSDPLGGDCDLTVREPNAEYRLRIVLPSGEEDQHGCLV
jgi:hypothetical protein